MGASVDGREEKPDRVPAAAQGGQRWAQNREGTSRREERIKASRSGRGWKEEAGGVEADTHSLSFHCTVKPSTEGFCTLREGRNGSLLGAGEHQPQGDQ